MEKLQKETLVGICQQMAAHPWEDAELQELVDPQLGVITGLQELLDELEALRQVDLGTLPPALSVQRR